MKPTDLNLATRPLRNQLLPGALLAGLALAALAFTLYNLIGYSLNARAASFVSRQIGAQRTILEELRKERMGLDEELGRLDLEALQEQGELANRLLLRRGLQWTRLFNELEAVQPYHVRLTSVRPTVAREGVELSVTGWAMAYDDELEYINRLEASPLFSGIWPRTENQDASGIRFALRMAYYPGRAPDPEVPGAADTDGQGAGDEQEPPPGEGSGLPPEGAEEESRPVAGVPEAVPAIPTAAPTAGPGDTGKEG